MQSLEDKNMLRQNYDSKKTNQIKNVLGKFQIKKIKKQKNLKINIKE